MTRGSFVGMKNIPQPLIYGETQSLKVEKLLKK